MSENRLTLENLDPILRVAVDAALDKKAIEVVVLDMRGLASFTDYFLICTGNSHRQMKSISEEISEKLRASNERPKHTEGLSHGEWILMDYVDFVVHIFTPTSRDYYELERLWGDASRLAVAI